jgi:hypothetical protein
MNNSLKIFYDLRACIDNTFAAATKVANTPTGGYLIWVIKLVLSLSNSRYGNAGSLSYKTDATIAKSVGFRGSPNTTRPFIRLLLKPHLQIIYPGNEIEA